MPLPKPKLSTLGIVKLFGTIPDAWIAKIVECRVSEVTAARQALGIGRFQTKIPQHSGRKLDHWTAEEIAMLGNESDSVVARKLGRTQFAVRNKRQSLGVEANWPFRGGPARVRWTDAHLKLLGTMTDREVAAIVGCDTNTAQKMRVKLGIPALRKKGGRA